MSNTAVSDVDPVVAKFLIESRIYFTYFQIATVALLCYDVATTLDREIKYFWSRPRRHITWVYLAVRISAIQWNAIR
ncbi:uncharacterized protein FOMMEDRAFT_159436 [Fomitiporia mediterranea MF3/22]|uniref:uncharacterized protein n=1 Tax=Fomitiporia mediterranea (strain MF3/22) TaxID=694068 RepID=UPI0004407B79|nr:uncharacterized protein FOMMEDRAFT_159436 [Fomitiporia mediterranea MF3/22]EJD00670.1 hypothetical protein FOMMEDRAFT_159436 [Fomitiporia mediterranea MF3/22]